MLSAISYRFFSHLNLSVLLSDYSSDMVSCCKSGFNLEPIVHKCAFTYVLLFFCYRFQVELPAQPVNPLPFFLKECLQFLGSEDLPAG